MISQIIDQFQNWIKNQGIKWERIKSDIISSFPESRQFLAGSYLVVTSYNQVSLESRNIEDVLVNILNGCQVEVRYPTSNMLIIDKISKHAHVDTSSFGIRTIIEGKFEIKKDNQKDESPADSKPGNDAQTESDIPAGMYLVKIISFQKKQSENGDYLDWNLEIISGEFKGNNLRVITSLKPTALWFLGKMVKALGCKVNSNTNFQDFVGKCLKVNVIPEKYNNKFVSKIVNFYPC